MTQPPTEGPVIRPFADWLLETNGGRTHAELGEALRTLTDAVRDTGKKGTLTVTFSLETLDSGMGNALVVHDEIKVRTPQHDRKKSIFYPDKHGNLTREDPNMLPFESLREVPTAAEPITLHPERNAQ